MKLTDEHIEWLYGMYHRLAYRDGRIPGSPASVGMEICYRALVRRGIIIPLT